ncbi:MAG TPA: hypothetical protein VGJ66_18240 [Pyrinomonadaceae bacterium]|jgi:hypothetical protein
MSNPKMNVASRAALLLSIILALVFAAGCATEEPANNSNSSAPSSATGTTPATNPSPAVSPSPTASPSPKEKTK